MQGQDKSCQQFSPTDIDPLLAAIESTSTTFSGFIPDLIRMNVDLDYHDEDDFNDWQNLRDY